MSQLIGYPMGSTLLFDGTTVSQVKEEEVNVDLELDELESFRDNRNILDRSDNQELTAEDIQSLKSAGLKGNVSINIKHLNIQSLILKNEWICCLFQGDYFETS